MAKIFPEYIPESCKAEPGKTGELLVYDALAKLPDDYTVFYNVEWLCRNRGAAYDCAYPDFIDEPLPSDYPLGEIDFVVLDPGFGWLVLEVKGGRIKLENGTWFSISVSGAWHRIDDPIRQARRNMYALIHKLKEMPRFRNRHIYSGYGAVLPQVASPQRDFGPAAPLQLFGFAEDLTDPERLVQRLRDQWRQRWIKNWSGRSCKETPDCLHMTDIEHITRALAPSMELRKVPMGLNIRRYKQDILKLTEDQFRLLQFLSKTTKALITGGAGTGKTMLAFQKARQLALQGYETLFTCPNKLLADALSFQAGGLDNLTVCHFHQLCYRWGLQAGFKELVDPDGPRQAQLPRDYFFQTLPNALLDALKVIPTRFDAVIVDEGQDMKPEYWDILQLCMQDPAAGIFYIFYDQNQSIWEKEENLPFKMEPFTLVENLRNNRLIHNLLISFYNRGQYVSRGPAGGGVEYITIDSYENRALEKKLNNLLHGLVSREQVSPSDIAILTGTSKNKSVLAGLEKFGRYPLVDRCQNDPSQIFFSSIRRFRGMERPVIILIELETLVCPESDQENNLYGISQASRETLYIGLSRA